MNINMTKLIPCKSCHFGRVPIDIDDDGNASWETEDCFKCNGTGLFKENK